MIYVTCPTYKTLLARRLSPDACRPMPVACRLTPDARRLTPPKSGFL